MEELNAEGADGHAVAGLDGVQVGFLLEARPVQLHLQQAHGELGGEDWHALELLDHVGDRACVILVSVGHDDPPDDVLLVVEIAKIGDDIVDPQHIVFGEHDAGVDDQDVVAVLNGHHVLANFPQAAQGNESQILTCHKVSLACGRIRETEESPDGNLADRGPRGARGGRFSSDRLRRSPSALGPIARGRN